MSINNRIVLIIVGLLAMTTELHGQCTTSGSGTALANLAASTTVNSWCQLTPMTNWFVNGGSQLDQPAQQVPNASNPAPDPTCPNAGQPPGLYGGNSADQTTAYQYNGVWDSKTQQLFFWGGGHFDTRHCGSPVLKRFVKYTASSNSWAVLWDIQQQPYSLPIGQSASHADGFNALDPFRRTFYYNDFVPADFPNNTLTGAAHYITYNIDGPNNAGNWSRIPDPPCNYCPGAGSNAFFPDMEKLIVVNGADQENGAATTIFGYNPIGNSWDLRITKDVNNNSIYTSGIQGETLYDSVHHIIYFGGGVCAGIGGCTPGDPNFNPNTGSNHLYKMDYHGVVTKLADSPTNIGTHNSVDVVDPVTGDILSWQGDNVLRKYNLETNTWSVVPTTIPTAMYYPGSPNSFAVIATPVPDFGGTLWVGWNSPGTASVWFFKESDTLTLNQKCTRTGTLHCWQFDSMSDLKYNWDPGNTGLTAQMASLGVSTNYTISTNRTPGEGNTHAQQEVSSPNQLFSIPIIDTAIKFEGGGSLRFNVPQYAGQGGGGFFQDNIDGVLHAGTTGDPNKYISLASPFTQDGIPLREYYLQFKFRTNHVFQDTFIWEFSMFQIGLGASNGSVAVGCFSCNANPAHQAQTDGFIPEMVGKTVYFASDGTNANCVTGFYTIVTVVDGKNATFDRSPASGGTCTGGQITVGTLVGTDVGGSPAPGWKSVITNQEAPHNGNLEVVIQNSNQHYAPQTYSTRGSCAPPENQLNELYKVDTWQEITLRVIPYSGGGTSPCGGASNARVTWWVDGRLAYEWYTDHIEWDNNGLTGEGNGLGDLQLTPFHTQRDPLQQTSGESLMWLDDVITSVTPIPMTGSAANAANPNAPTLTSISPNNGNPNTVVTVNLVGTNFINGSGQTNCNISGSGITVGSFNFTDTAHGSCSLTISSGAATDNRSFSVTTINGTSSPLTFTVNGVNPPPPTLASPLNPNSGAVGTTVTVNLTGTNFISGGTTVAITGTGMSAGSFTFISSSSGSVPITIGGGVTPGAYTLTVTTASGTSNGLPFTANAVSTLTISKTGPSNVNPSTPMTYTIGLGNSGPTTSGTSATVKDQLPAGTIVNSCTPGRQVSTVVCSGTGSPGAMITATVTMSAGIPPSSATGTAAFTMNATSPGGGPNSITNYSSVDSTGGTNPPTPGPSCSGSCSAFTTMINPNLIPSFTLSKVGPVNVNTNAAFTITIGLGNSGGTTSGLIATIADQLPPGVSATACNISTGVFSVSCTNLNTPGALVTATVTLIAGLGTGVPSNTAVFTMAATAPSGTGAITNYASVDATGGTSPPTPGASCVTANCANAVTNVLTPIISTPSRIRLRIGL